MDNDDNKKIEKAAALKYDKGQSQAPTLVAKGRGDIAKRILEIAAEHDIPIHSDEDLVEILEKLEIEEEIPLEVYTVVAEIFAYLYKINGEQKA